VRLGPHHGRLIHIALFFDDHGHFGQVLAQNATPWGQAILNQVVVELDHGLQRCVNHPKDDIEAG